MCGIAGFYNSNFNKQDLLALRETLMHRGPDAQGVYFDATKKVGLAHTRLSILDLSKAANQPYYSKCGRYVMVYNGEIYNYKELAKKHKLNTLTTSDTEVILELFVKLGAGFVHELNGMFAIIIYDIVSEDIYLFRDRIGIKPLYYYINNKSLVFASELKSFKELSLSLSINKNAIANFLLVGYIPHDKTIYNEIKKVPSGSYIKVNKGDFEIKNSWKPNQIISKETVSNEQEAKTTLKGLIESSVSYRMISDVPFGTFLSGGTDSGLVTAVAQSISATKINTFSIGFKEAKYNEAEHAAKVASFLSTNHHEFILSEKDAIEQVDNLLNVYDEPFADSSAIPTLLVSQMAKKEVTVTLSGDGGDELFMGYGMYNWAARLSNPVIKQVRKPISFILGMGGNREKRAARVFNYTSEKRIKSHIFSQEQYFFSEKEIGELLLEFTPVTIEEEYLNLPRNLSAREEQAFFDLSNYLKDDLLVKVDRASMFHSLETRVPLLDHRIVEFALNLDESLKVKDGISKYLLKEVLYDYVPQQLMSRPKWGFSVPLEKWLKNDLKYLTDKYLSKEYLELTAIFNVGFVQNLVRDYLGGKSYLYNRVWQLIVLQKWLIKNE